MQNKLEYLGLLMGHLYGDNVVVAEDKDGFSIAKWDVEGEVAPTDLEQFVEDHAELVDRLVAAVIKKMRNRLLRSSDWTQLSDTPEEETEIWADYRKALWEIDKQEGFPHEVKWPAPPA